MEETDGAFDAFPWSIEMSSKVCSIQSSCGGEIRPRTLLAARSKLNPQEGNHDRIKRVAAPIIGKETPS